MDETNRDLWQRLDAFELDDPAASLTFSRRLARENDWDHDFANRVVEEYKRFVFLAMTAGHQVTPSDEVDQAWHLHLTYTRSYWDELCGEVLGQPLHHGPTKGGKQEGERFEDQYERTLASYRQAFGEEPPADIWPASEIRFGESADFVRVNKQRVWLITKPVGFRSRTTMVAALGGLLFVPPLAAQNDDGVIRLIFFAVGVAIIGQIVFRVLRPPKRRGRRNRRGSSSSSSNSGWLGGWFGGDGCSSDSGCSSGCGGVGCGGGGCGGGGCGGV